MPGDIGNLMTIIGVGAVGHIASILIGILGTYGSNHIATYGAAGLTLHIDALDVHLSQVEHRPSELLPFGIGHNLIVHRIVVDVSLKMQTTHHTAVPLVVVAHTAIILQSRLRHQVGSATYLRIVKVVERRHAEALLGIKTHRKVLTLKRIDIHKEGRSKHRRLRTIG